jgi:hypothetical protein
MEIHGVIDVVRFCAAWRSGLKKIYSSKDQLQFETPPVRKARRLGPLAYYAGDKGLRRAGRETRADGRA